MGLRKASRIARLVNRDSHKVMAVSLLLCARQEHRWVAEATWLQARVGPRIVWRSPSQPATQTRVTLELARVLIKLAEIASRLTPQAFQHRPAPCLLTSFKPPTMRFTLGKQQTESEGRDAYGHRSQIELVDLADVEGAAHRIRPYMVTTPLLTSRAIDEIASEAVSLPEGPKIPIKLCFKAEHLQVVG